MAESAESDYDVFSKIPQTYDDYDQIHPPQVFLVIGPVGCGKSTYRKKLVDQYPEKLVSICIDDIPLTGVQKNNYAWYLITRAREFGKNSSDRERLWILY